jgi:hypothetical protein
MKKLLLIILIIATMAPSSLAIKVYVSRDRIAGKKVYITQNRWEAQMFVFYVQDPNQANKPYLWYEVRDRNTASLTISYVMDHNQADLIIYIVTDKNLAHMALKTRTRH